MLLLLSPPLSLTQLREKSSNRVGRDEQNAAQDGALLQEKLPLDTERAQVLVAVFPILSERKVNRVRPPAAMEEEQLRGLGGVLDLQVINWLVHQPLLQPEEGAQLRMERSMEMI